MNRLIGAAKPHLWKIIDLLKREETLNTNKYYKFEKRGIVKLRSAREDLKDEKIKNLKYMYRKNDLILDEYLLKLTEFINDFSI